MTHCNELPQIEDEFWEALADCRPDMHEPDEQGVECHVEAGPVLTPQDKLAVERVKAIY